MIDVIESYLYIQDAIDPIPVDCFPSDWSISRLQHSLGSSSVAVLDIAALQKPVAVDLNHCGKLSDRITCETGYHQLNHLSFSILTCSFMSFSKSLFFALVATQPNTPQQFMKIALCGLQWRLIFNCKPRKFSCQKGPPSTTHATCGASLGTHCTLWTQWCQRCSPALFTCLVRWTGSFLRRAL